jgi:hypothetical protein
MSLKPEGIPVLATWDIRSGNRHVVHDGTGLLAPSM